MRKFIVGNWKMNGLAAGVDEALALAAALKSQPSAARTALCPPATLVGALAHSLAGSAVEIGAQDCHAKTSGAFTGDLSAEMLKAAGASLVILGHSERRAGHHETDADIAAKVEAALRAGLEPIVCCGESLEERQSGEALPRVRAQLTGSLPAALQGTMFSVAYEPIWAIGSGLTPTLAEIEEVHLEARRVLVERFGEGARVPILYGGSVKPDNAHAILAAAEVGGALVGGASLKCADFLPIVRAAG